jgi:plastocyanin
MLRVVSVVLVACAWACPHAMAVDQTVTTGALTFSPPSVSISQGEKVTWQNTSGGFHNVFFDDGQFDMPPDPIDTMWSVTRIFAQPGTYRYVCEAHVADGMIGTVVVNAAPPGGGGGGGGGGPGSGTGPADTAPLSSLAGPAKQDVDKLFVRASMNEAGTLAAGGTVSVPGGAKAYSLKRVTRSVKANQTVKLRLKLRSRSLKAVKRALRSGRKARALITLTAQDATGKRTLRKQTIRLRS